MENKDRRVIIQRIAAVAALGYVAPKVVTIREAEADSDNRRRRPPPSQHHGDDDRGDDGGHDD